MHSGDSICYAVGRRGGAKKGETRSISVELSN